MVQDHQYYHMFMWILNHPGHSKTRSILYYPQLSVFNQENKPEQVLQTLLLPHAIISCFDV